MKMYRCRVTAEVNIAVEAASQAAARSSSHQSVVHQRAVQTKGDPQQEAEEYPRQSAGGRMIGVTVAVASGLVEVDEHNFKRLRREVRRELRACRIRLQPWGSEYRLIRKHNKGGHRRLTHLGRGDLVECCMLAMKHITPSNPETQK
jgi:hypothetical protein